MTNVRVSDARVATPCPAAACFPLEKKVSNEGLNRASGATALWPRAFLIARDGSFVEIKYFSVKLCSVSR